MAASSLPPISDLGPLLLVIFFLLALPILLLLRYGHTYRRFQVEPNRLAVLTLWQRWAIDWADVAQLVRRTTVGPLGTKTFRVRVQLCTAEGKVDWINLFDSGLPAADDFYAQLVAHLPHLQPKEIEDIVPRNRRRF